jgi:hypothetical protein
MVTLHKAEKLRGDGTAFAPFYIYLMLPAAT